MKKKYLFAAALLALGLSSNAQTTYQDVFPEWANSYQIADVLQIFKEANGQPLTDAQLGLIPDWQFRQSHEPLREVISSKNGQLNPELEPLRNVFFNCPIGKTKVYASQPSTLMSDDAFTLWPYVKIHGNWSTGFFGAPGNFMDAAHKHGTIGLSGLVFYDTYSSAATELINMLTTKDNGKYVYVDALLDALQFFGHDGINFNDEINFYNSEFGGFLEALREKAAERNQPFYVGWYAYPSFSSGNNPGYFGPSGKIASNVYMLNYGSMSQTATTEAQAENLVTQGKISEEDIYNIYNGKWIVGLGPNDGYRSSFDGIQNGKKIGLAPWGEHDQNRILQHTDGRSAKEVATEYQRRLEMFFSGGHRNLAMDDSDLAWAPSLGGISSETLADFKGLGQVIPERSAVTGSLPFSTGFCVGSGQYFYNCGEALHTSWYNLGAQDIMPTYRWLVLNAVTKAATTDIDPSFTFDDAWIGGTSLKLSGKATAEGTDIHLYRTDLTVGNTAKAQVIFKAKNVNKGDNSNLYLILKKNGSENWDEFALGNVEINGYNGWDIKSVNLNGYAATDKITAIGLRVKGSKDNFETLIGQLFLDNGTKETVAAPKNLIIEKINETQVDMTLKMTWTMADMTKLMPVYNKDVNVDHFEIFLKKGDYRKKMIATTTQWGYVISDVLTANDETLRVGIRAVSSDLQSKSAIVWQEIEKDPFADEKEEPDLYCACYNNVNANSADVAPIQRYLKEIKIEGAKQNITITNERGGSDKKNVYKYGEDQKFVVDPGTTFTLSWIANGYDGTETGVTSAASDGLQYTRAYVYCDWNRDYEFDPNDAPGNEDNLWYGAGMGPNWGIEKGECNPVVGGERVIAYGAPQSGNATTNQTARYKILKRSFTIKVPDDAKGGISRMRIIFDDGWFNHEGACSTAITKGLTVDLTMEITGEDSGDGGETKEEVIVGDEDLQSDSYTPADGTIVGIENNAANTEVSIFYPSVAQEEIFFNFTDKVEIYSLQGTLVSNKKANKVYNMNIANLPTGTYIVKMFNGDIITTGKLIKK